MVKWKIPAWAAAAGAAISLAAGIAAGNPFGTILLRALACALLAGGLGLGARQVLKRFLPDLGAPAPQGPPESVDILLDEEVPLPAAGRQERPEEADSALAEAAETPAEVLEEGLPFADSLESDSDSSADLAAQPEAAEQAFEPAEEGEALEALPVDGGPADLGGEERGLPSRRSLKAEELETQLDSVTKGQDPASLAKAVRTFLRKDQEG